MNHSFFQKAKMMVIEGLILSTLYLNETASSVPVRGKKKKKKICINHPFCRKQRDWGIDFVYIYLKGTSLLSSSEKQQQNYKKICISAWITPFSRKQRWWWLRDWFCLCLKQLASVREKNKTKNAWINHLFSRKQNTAICHEKSTPLR